MSATRKWPQGQQLLLEPMKLLDYKINPSGHCMGFSKVVRDYILSRKAHHLNHHLDIIKNHSPSELVSKIRDAQQDQRRLALEKRARKEGKSANPSDDTLENKANRDQYLNLLYLFESIAFLQRPKRYPQLFKQHQVPTRQSSRIADKMVMSNELKQNGKIETLPITTDIYTIDKLASELTKLRDKLLLPTPSDYSISMILTNDGHAITIGYDPQYENPWIFANSSNLPILFLKTEKELAQHICSAFSSNKVATFATEISVTGNHHSDLNNRLGNFIYDKEFTNEKTKLITSAGVSWLYMAARYGDITSVKKLLNQGAVSTNKFRQSPLSVACLLGHTQCVEEFLKYKTTDINSRTIDLSYSPLMQAAKQGHSSIVKKLLEAGANYRLLGSDDKSALYLAVQRNHIDTVKELLKCGATGETYDEHTLVDLAKSKNNFTLAQILINAEDLNHKIGSIPLKYSHINVIRRKAIKEVYKIIQVDFDEQGNINYDTKQLYDFKKLDNLICDLLKLTADYSPKNTQRQINVINLQKGIQLAYDQYTNKAAPIDTIFTTLKQLVQQIAEDAKSSHLNEQSVIGKLFATKSRLNSRIQSIIALHNFNDNEFTVLKKSA